MPMHLGRVKVEQEARNHRLHPAQVALRQTDAEDGLADARPGERPPNLLEGFHALMTRFLSCVTASSMSITRRPSLLMVTKNQVNPRGEGPLTTAPLASKWLPWHGQRKGSLPGTAFTVQPRWGQMPLMAR